MKHLKKFNEEVNYNTPQSDDGGDIFGDDLNRIVWFVRDNEDKVLNLIEFWENTNGRDFDEEKYYEWFNKYMLYIGEDEDDENEDDEY